MWAIPVVPNRLITVVAKSAETFRVAILSQPTEKIATATQLLSLPVAAAVDVVNAEELVSGLAATSACLAVVLDSCGFQALMPIMSVGIALFLMETVPPSLRRSAPFSPARVILVPPVILSTIFPVALRIFSSALALPFGMVEHCRLVARKTYVSMIDSHLPPPLSCPETTI